MDKFLLLATLLTWIVCEVWSIGHVGGNTNNKIDHVDVGVIGFKDMKEESYTAGKHESFIGCSVWKMSTQVANPGETVIFEGIRLNEGNHYRPITGEFRCPFNGTYYTAVTVKADNIERAQLAITRNSKDIVEVNENQSKPYNTVTNSCVMRCEAGDVISVKVYGASSSVYGDTSVPYSSFTVILLYEGDMEQHHTGFDAFTSWKFRHQEVSAGDVVTFSEIIYDSPNYDQSDSRYFCPENGIYFVTVNIRKQDVSDLHIGVEHKSNTVLSVEDSESGNEWNQMSNSVLLHCARNETITVKAAGAGEVHGTSGYKYTTFSVLQIHSEENPRQNKHDEFVGCSLWKQSYQTYNSTDTIVYDGIALNSGNHFNRILNRFVCPFNGIYYVTATAKKDSTTDLQVNVLHATVTLFRLEDLGDSIPYNTVSNSALVRCFVGEAIQVQGAGPGSIFGLENNAFTTLNIFMMYEY